MRRAQDLFDTSQFQLYLELAVGTKPACTAALRMVCLDASDQAAGTVMAHITSRAVTLPVPHC